MPVCSSINQCFVCKKKVWKALMHWEVIGFFLNYFNVWRQQPFILQSYYAKYSVMFLACWSLHSQLLLSINVFFKHIRQIQVFDVKCKLYLSTNFYTTLVQSKQFHQHHFNVHIRLLCPAQCSNCEHMSVHTCVVFERFVEIGENGPVSRTLYQQELTGDNTYW